MAVFQIRVGTEPGGFIEIGRLPGLPTSPEPLWQGLVANWANPLSASAVLRQHYEHNRSHFDECHMSFRERLLNEEEYCQSLSCFACPVMSCDVMVVIDLCNARRGSKGRKCRRSPASACDTACEIDMFQASHSPQRRVVSKRMAKLENEQHGRLIGQPSTSSDSQIGMQCSRIANLSVERTTQNA